MSKEELLVGYKKTMGDVEANEIVSKIMQLVDSDNSGYIDYSGQPILKIFLLIILLTTQNSWLPLSIERSCYPRKSWRLRLRCLIKMTAARFLLTSWKWISEVTPNIFDWVAYTWFLWREQNSWWSMERSCERGRPWWKWRGIKSSWHTMS